MGGSKKQSNKDQTGEQRSTEEGRKPKSQKRRPPLHDYARFTGLGIQIAAIITIGVLAGDWIDEQLNTNIPYFTLFLSLFAIFASLYFIIKETSK